MTEEKQQIVCATGEGIIPSLVTITPVEPLAHNGSMDEVKEAAVIKIQRVFRCRHARKKLTELLMTVFEKFYDEDTGLYYYYNKRTGETTWEKPKVLKSDEDLPLAAMYEHQQQSKAYADEETTGAENETDIKLEDIDHDDEEPQDDDEDEEESEGEDEDEEDEDEDEVSGVDDRKITQFSAQERAIVRTQFDHYDTDHSGSINATELLKLLQTFGEPVTLRNVQEMIRQVDTNGNGEVEFEEFLQILQKQHEKNQYSASLELALLFGPKELDNLKKQFMKLDLDGSGFIDEHEIQELIKKLGKKAEEYDLKAMLREVDQDGSGTIGFNEFLQIIANMMKEDSNNNSVGRARSVGFAVLLDLGITQGLLTGLGDVLQQSKAKFHEWWNADMIAEQKRLDVKRERRRKQEEERRRQQEKDQAIYQAHQEKQRAIEAARKAPIEGLIHVVEFAGDELNYPTVGQFARVHYLGTFEKTGEVFESTRKRGGALEFCVGVGHLIKGFDLVLQRMSVGETAKVTMAPMLAYGVKGRPPRIPPNATLVFKIELISIKEKLHLAQDIMGGDDD